MCRGRKVKPKYSWPRSTESSEVKRKRRRRQETKR